MNTPTDFPNKVDLAIAPPEIAPDTALDAAPKGKKSKPVYPSLYLSDAEGLDSAPKEGYALIYYRRRSLTMSETEEGDHHSADLEIQEISFPEQSAEGEQSDMRSAMASLAKEKGIETGDEESEETPEHEATETEEEETAEHENEDEED